MLIVALVVVAAVFGAAWGGAYGAASAAVLAWLLIRVVRLEKQVAVLEEALKRELPQHAGSPISTRSAGEAAAAQALHGSDAGDVDSGINLDAAADTGVAAASSAAYSSTAISTGSTSSAGYAGVLASTTSAASAAAADLAGAAAAASTSLSPPSPANLPPSPSASRAAPAHPPRPDPLAPIKAWLLGGNTIVKAGVGILFVGLAFLAKYASEHVQVPVELRLAGIGAVALALLFIGWRLRNSRPGYAQVLQGGAVAVLYLTLFVAFKFYGVIAVGPVFGLMVLVAALAAALAVLQNARTLAVIGALGGFATPLLVSTGGGNQVALFSYYLVLDLGIAAVAWFRTWRALNLIGFVGTYGVGAAWGLMRYQPEHYLSSQGFLVAFFLLFTAVLLMPARQLREDDASLPAKADGWVNGSLLFGLPAITFVLQHGLVRHTDYGTAISALVLAAFYVALAFVMRSRPRLAVTFDASLAMATVFLTLVIPFALDARSTAGAWALEGAGLVWLGFRQRRGGPRLFGYALLGLSALAMLVAHDRHGVPTNLFNAYLFNALLAAAASLAAAYFVRRAGLAAPVSAGSAATSVSTAAPAPAQAPPVSAVASGIGSGFASALGAVLGSIKPQLVASEPRAEPVLIGLGTLWALVATAAQVDAFVPARYSLAAWLTALSAIALIYTLGSRRLDWPRLGLPVIAHAPLLGCGVLISMATQSSPVAGGGAWAWPLALATHALVLWRAAPRWPAAAQTLVHALGVLVLAALGALQGRALTQSWGDTSSAWAWLGWLVVPALLLLWLPRPALANRWPLSAAPRAYQALAAAVLTAGLLLWTLLANIASNGSAQPLPYVPLANPLDLGVGVALLAAWLWLRSEAASEWVKPAPQVPVAALGITGFVWLNAMLIRAFHHFGGVPFRVDAWLHSAAVQTGIALLWSATALVLMWLSARRATRLPWMVGAALLVAVVLKLMLVDLSGSGTVTRIVSFIGVGVLMLVIGYVAPLPSKEKEPAHAPS